MWRGAGVRFLFYGVVQVVVPSKRLPGSSQGIPLPFVSSEKFPSRKQALASPQLNNCVQPKPRFGQTVGAPDDATGAGLVGKPCNWIDCEASSKNRLRIAV